MEEELYYIEVPNCGSEHCPEVHWVTDNHETTTNINKARKFNKEESLGHVAKNNDHILWLVEYIVSKSVPVVNFFDLNNTNHRLSLNDLIRIPTKEKIESLCGKEINHFKITDYKDGVLYVVVEPTNAFTEIEISFNILPTGN